MSEHGGGGDGPVFIDIYGTSGRLGLGGDGGRGNPHGYGGPHPEGPLWLRGLRGELPLWMAFWGGFFFGHGIVIAFSVGIVLIAVVIGFTIEPTNVDDSISKAALILVPVGVIVSLFVAWASVTVWRSAPRAKKARWGIAARAVIAAYLACLGFILYHLFG